MTTEACIGKMEMMASVFPATKNRNEFCGVHCAHIMAGVHWEDINDMATVTVDFAHFHDDTSMTRMTSGKAEVERAESSQFTF